jgi:hypothetical protein
MLTTSSISDVILAWAVSRLHSMLPLQSWQPAVSCKGRPPSLLSIFSYRRAAAEFAWALLCLQHMAACADARVLGRPLEAASCCCNKQACYQLAAARPQAKSATIGQRGCAWEWRTVEGQGQDRAVSAAFDEVWPRERLLQQGLEPREGGVGHRQSPIEREMARAATSALE